MSKLYIFGIGGTGARVLRSLTMLMSAGVQCDVDTIVPIIIDRDESNKDLTRTKSLIDQYIYLNKKANVDSKQTGSEKNRFFKTKIKPLSDGIILKLEDTKDKFDEYIGFGSMTPENKALTKMLFSKDLMELDMSVGFQGNPNIGSVVLNQFTDSEVFKQFANTFQVGDKIFIISSIFGGTGASGFPLLRKVLQTENAGDSKGNQLNNWGLVNEAHIGAITVLPYFIVEAAKEGDNSLVNSDTFSDKARAALSYYKQEDKKIDTLYYIADTRFSTFEHNKGGKEQANDAHFVELASALAILDFVQKPSKNIHRDKDENTIQKTTYKEFGIEKNSLSLSFINLDVETRLMIANPLSRFFLFSRYMNQYFETERRKQPFGYPFRNDLKSDEALLTGLKKLQKEFMVWLEEMESDKHERKFSPFEIGSPHAFKSVKQINVESGGRFKDWDKVNNELNNVIKEVKDIQSLDKKLFDLFYRMTENLINYQY